MNTYAAYYVMRGGADPSGQKLMVFAISTDNPVSKFPFLNLEHQIKQAKKHLREQLKKLKFMSQNAFLEARYRGIYIRHRLPGQAKKIEELYNGLDKQELIDLIQNELDTYMTIDEAKLKKFTDHIGKIVPMLKDEPASKTFGDITIHTHVYISAHGSMRGDTHILHGPSSVGSSEVFINAFNKKNTCKASTTLVSCRYPDENVNTTFKFLKNETNIANNGEECSIFIDTIDAIPVQSVPDKQIRPGVTQMKDIFVDPFN